MSSYKYSTLRSTTPPLYYKRPEGTAPAYYTVPTRDTFQIGAANTAAAPAAQRDSVAAPPTPRASYAMPSVANPFLTTPSGAKGPLAASAPPPVWEPQNPASYLQERGAARWSHQRREEPNVVASLEAEAASLAAEEAALKAQLAEAQSERRRQEEEQLYLSHGWSSLLEREEQYYTEPVVDLSQDIAAREHRCAELHSQLQQAELHLSDLEQQVQYYDPLMKERESMEKEIDRVRSSFEGLERRRQQCIGRAERYFDVETKRAVEGNRAVHKLDAQLKKMTQTGPLAQLQSQESSQAPSRSASRCVSFANMKSIVLDAASDASASMEPPRDPPQGLTSSSSNNTYGGVAAPGAYAPRHDTGDASVCIGLDEEDIGGTSIAFSLNNSNADAAKRRRMEVLAAM
ncbi:hypothetical protein STCU_05299 [Strigomonas culicis]|uniref:Uncharacterized protein n=1 Tax=Strigomonas culicis TaxID=28005 RepID=S9UHC4_9TRYP|nr:hypothetical protein STCU_05299 [Strigomonas culicis]|eukprot:EPY28104.1 hypothetical protein STCU_05299 [Strigomonas culicis]